MSNKINGLTNEQIAAIWQKAIGEPPSANVYSPHYAAHGGGYGTGLVTISNSHVPYPSTTTAFPQTNYGSYTPAMRDVQADFKFDDIIRMRLGLTPGAPLPFQYISHHRVSHEQHIVFLVQGGKALIIEDGELFPSDKLITQLRLIAQ